MTIANYPMANNINTAAVGALWMKIFKNEADDLMETAIISCLNFCTMFPTIAEIKAAIRDLHYEEQTQPRQLPWGGKWDVSKAKKVFDIAKGKQDTKTYLASVDVTELNKYARLFFPDISEELVLRNYPELLSGKQCSEMCFACRTERDACSTQGWIIKHCLNTNGFINNTMAKCHKNTIELKHEYKSKGNRYADYY